MTLTPERMTSTSPDAVLDGLIDWKAGLIDRRIFHDDTIYQQELEQIFARCWIFLCPEQQIPRKGDFFATSMGEDPVLVVRQRDGSIRAFLNSCRHRGMKVCRADMGNAKGFTCTYHGWAYDTAGNLVNLPFEEKGYHNELPKDEWGLIPVAQLDTYNGLVFATWDPSAPPLQDYLGDGRFLLDGITARRSGGYEVCGGVLRWRFKGNWKFAAEQFTSDNYHAPFSHASALQALMSTLPPDRVAKLAEFLEIEDELMQFSSRLGHGSGFVLNSDVPAEQVAGADETYEYFRDVVIPEARARKDQPWVLTGHNNIFPSLGFLTSVPTLRSWIPRGPHEMEVTAWVLVDRDAPQPVKDAWRRSSILTFSGSGLFEQDDGENWGEIQKVLRGRVQGRYRFNYQMGLGHDGDRGDGLGVPGTLGYTMNEMAARGFYRRYAELMSGRPWSELPPLTAG